MVKFKTCAGCGPGKIIYKNIDGEPYCKFCTMVIQPPKRIMGRSKKRAAQERVYLKKAKTTKLQSDGCFAKLPGCTGYDVTTLTISHTKGRIGDLLLDKTHQQVICSHCHNWVTNHPKEAKKLGLEFSRLSKN